MVSDFETKKTNLKLIRNKFLRLHKVLMDNDREGYESEHGVKSPGQFLEILLSDEKFAWLRIVSMLIVRIDEAFDLDDGMSSEMLEGFYTEIGDMFDQDSEEYQEFKDNLNLALQKLDEAALLKTDIENLMP